jgi:hypothetical protein
VAALTITVGREAGTGRTTVAVGLRSDADALPQEHEELHRRLAAVLLPAAGVRRDRPAREAAVG